MPVQKNLRRWLTFFRNRRREKTITHLATATVPLHSPNTELRKQIGDQCTECGACLKSCSFLKYYGTPKTIVNQFDFSLAESQSIAYECSLCGLCSAICPEKIDPAAFFLEVRRLSCDADNLNEAKYRTILGYEKTGTSQYFSWYGLPEGCDTIFFPGCTLPGTRPEVTDKLFRQIRQMIPTVGMVLDCCTKPSHDLGRSDYFKKMFGEMHSYLVSQGIRTVLTACPNCTKIFRQYGHGLRVKTVYEILHSPTSADYFTGKGLTFTVHDPCPLRNDRDTQQAVRKMLDEIAWPSPK